LWNIPGAGVTCISIEDGDVIQKLLTSSPNIDIQAIITPGGFEINFNI